MAGLSLTNDDYVRAGATLKCEPAAVMAFTLTESPKSGFLPSGKMTCLFEGAKFHSFTGGKYDADHPTLSFPTWTKQYYLGGEAEWTRVDLAASLDRVAAYKATSFGRFQIMGFNFALCGYANVDAFVANMALDEGHQLDAFVQFIIHDGLQHFIQAKDWTNLALHYNGSGYKANQYDTKLEANYDKAKTILGA